MSTPVKNFSGLEFDLAIGQVYGVRAWSVDKHGRLRAKRYPGAAPWRPGVNVADCRASESGWYSQGGWVLSTFFTAPVGTPPPIAEPDKPKEKHSAPDESCGCGFYAYTGDDHPEVKDREDHDVIGVVRGTGRTLIGTKGFRCEKAEIVALLDPTRRSAVGEVASSAAPEPDAPLPQGAAAGQRAAVVADVPDRGHRDGPGQRRVLEPPVTFYLVCLLWLLLSLASALGFGKTIRLRDQGGPR